MPLFYNLLNSQSMTQNPNTQQLIIFLLIILITLLFRNIYLRNKKKQNYLQFSNEREKLQNLIESTPIPLYTFNEKNVLVNSNEEGKRLIQELGQSFWIELEKRIVNNLESQEKELLQIPVELDSKTLSLNLQVVNNKVKLVWIQDLTELISKEKREKELKDLLEKSLEIAKLGSYSYSLSNGQDIEMQSISKITLEILGINNPDDKVEFSVKNIFDQSNLQAFKDLIIQHLNSDTYFNHEFKIKNLKSEEKWIRVIGKVSGNINKTIQVKGIIQDLTIEKKLLESLKSTVDKERAINKMKSNFVSMTSHEFRTPLSIAMSSLELMLNYLEKVDNEDIKLNLNTQIQRIERQIDRITFLLEDVLVLEKTSFADRNLNLEAIDLELFFSNLIFELQSLLDGNRSIHLKISGKKRSLQSDRTLFFHLFHNLLTNAIKFSEKDILIHLNFDSAISVKIQDFGIGISEEEKVKIFDFFYRGSNAREIKGTGLGLVIVKEIVEKLSYELSFESAENEGTTFKIKF